MLLCGALSMLVGFPSVQAQSQKQQPSITDVSALLHDVTAKQKRIEQLREDYDYSETIQTKDFDGKGRLKQTKTEEFEIFFVNDKHIRRLVRLNGKLLDANEEKKEQERVSKEVEKASKASADDVANANNLRMSRMMENTRLIHPRREVWKGRDTIVFDFLSNPKAKTQSEAESAFKQMSGTVWIDEKDKTIARLSARFDQNFHIAGGLVASVHKGSTVTLDQALINKEIWLPVRAEAHIDARVLLFKGVSEEIVTTTSNYQKFSVGTSQKTPGVVHPPA